MSMPAMLVDGSMVSFVSPQRRGDAEKYPANVILARCEIPLRNAHSYSSRRDCRTIAPDPVGGQKRSSLSLNIPEGLNEM